MNEPRVVLLGPQRPVSQLGDVVRELGVAGPVATITAGWQEWESEDAELRALLGRAMQPVHLYARAERAWAADSELREAHRRMQSDLRLVRSLYARQLERAGEAWIELLDTDGPERLLGPEREAALDAIRRLDAHHLRRIEEVQAEFRDRVRPLEREAVARERAEIVGELDEAKVVVIEGGHVAVLSNRIGLFELAPLFATKTLIGCSAGAMLLCERIVLFNDAPAIGRGHAEVGLPGLGVVRDLVVLPDAHRRLRLEDPARMRRLALRFAPARCALLDSGDRLDWDGRAVSGRGGRYVGDDGAVAPREWAA